MIPLCRVELHTLEVINALNERKRWLAEWAVAENEDIGSKLTLRSGDVPASVSFIPKSFLQFGVPKNVRKDAVVFRTAA